MRTEITKDVLRRAAAAFQTKGELRSCVPYGSGHINDTFRLDCEIPYILQRMNRDIFRDIPALMRNISLVTNFLREKILSRGGDPERECLNLIPTRDGKSFYRDPDGECWRAYLFIERASSYNLVRRPEDFRESGRAFGNFQLLLSDFDASLLTETIADFHDTKKRFLRFREALTEDPLGRGKSCEREIRFALSREMLSDRAMSALREGRLPLRVCHNDTKLNNIMIDDESGKAVCIIDLDTVMPGLSLFDFGDSIRFGASTAEEDERDLSKVHFSLPLYELYREGYLEGSGGSLTEEEIRMLPESARLMTLECGVRFLTDYLSGDHYFHTSRPGHNLDRARTQFRLLEEMEEKLSLLS